MKGFTLSPNERIIRVFSQSKWVLFKPFFLSLVAILVPWWYVLGFGLISLRTPVIIGTILILLYVAREYALWSLGKYVITSHRVIKTEYHSLFKKVVVETPLERILNVSFKTTGIFSFLGRFGDVHVQVVGLMEPMTLKSITQPAKIKEYLWRAHEEAAKRDGFDAAHLQEQIGYTKPNQRVI
jgi:hypothetical protein